MNPATAPSGFGFGSSAAAPAAPATATPAPAPAATGFGAVPDPAAAAAPAPGQTPPPAAPPAGGNPATPAAQATAIPAAATSPSPPRKKATSHPSPPLDLMTKLRGAVAEGSLSADLRQDLKTRFSAPFKPPSSATASVSQPAPSLGGMAGFGATQPAASLQAANAKPGGQLHQFSQLSSAQERHQASANARNVRHATEFLNVLLMCDSGFNNIEVPSDALSSADSESVKGLHAAVAEFASSAASNVVAYLSQELVPRSGAMMGQPASSAAAAGEQGLIAIIAQHTVTTSAAPPVSELQRVLDGSTSGGVSSAAAVGSSSSSSAGAGAGLLIATSLAQSNPILLSAQCLYLLTRHFQLPASLLKSVLELLHQLLRQVRVDLQGQPIEFSRFRSGKETKLLCALLWFVAFSVVNLMAVWKKLRGAEGRLEENALLRTAAADTLDGAITAMRREFEVQGENQTSDADNMSAGHQFLPSSATAGGSGGAMGGLLGRVSASRRRAGATRDGTLGSGAEAGQLTVDGKVIGGYGQFSHRWEVIVQAYLSILTLAEACFLRGKQDDASYEKACDKAVEAFLGDRESNPTSMCRGKAAKRMHQLMPLPSTVFVPVEIMYVAPYEVLSYLFDYMVPFLRRISELEVASFGRYVRQMEALEERTASGTGGSAGGGLNSTQSTGFASRHHHYGQAMRALLPEERNYAMDGVARNSGITQQLVPFTSEMSHILETLAACLQNLPPEVLNPDLDADCAATFFILTNFTKHLSQVLKLQRASAGLWESFTHKMVARYLDVLSMIGRNQQYIERVVKLLSSTQAECPELEWGNLVAQALECTGLSRNGAGASGGEMGLSVGGGGLVSRSSATATLTNPASALSEVEEENAMHQSYRQFLPSFARKCQQNYVASFFMLMRQMFLHPELREIVRKYFTLELGLSMLHAQRHSQTTLGSTLSLISALIGGAEDAQKVLTHLREYHFLDPWTSVAAPGSVSANAMGSPSLVSGDRYATRNQLAEDPTQHLETRSLLGHCEYEATLGRYSITVGFLNLLIALFRYDTPGMESFEIYTSITHFVAHKIFIGVSRRNFEKETERGTVTALAAAALRHALLMCFTTDGSVNVIPFQTVMATVKAPSDVLGELLGITLKASARTAELSVHECAAVRQCLRLLSTAIQAPSRQLRNDPWFDARALSSAMLPFRVLLLCAGRDALLTHAVLRVLTLLPSATMTEASHMWHAHNQYFAGVVAALADTLDPLQVGALVSYAPPELVVLDYDWGPQGSLKSLSPAAVLEENRSALVDLLIQHAPIREPSTAAWLCGLYTAVAASSSSPNLAPAHLDDTSILAAVMSGAQSASLAEAYPLLAVKYTRLLYELRANALYGATTIRPLMDYFRCHGLFLELQYFRPDKCHPLLLSKYAYVLKMLSLEVAFAYRTAPEQLNVAGSSIPSAAVEVALSLLERSGSEAEELSVPIGTAHGGQHGDDMNGADDVTAFEGSHNDGVRARVGAGLSLRTATVDIADWLKQAFARLPSFPDCRPPPSAKDLYVMRAADGVVQFNIVRVFNAVQLETIRTQRTPLTMLEARDKLQPYVEANYCFLLYASAVNFVEGWCELVNLAFCVVRGISLGRLRAFVQHILSGAEASMVMTRAAQEQVTFRLFSCLSTLMAQLKKQVELRARQVHQNGTSATATANAGAGAGGQADGRRLGITAAGVGERRLTARNSFAGATGVVDMTEIRRQNNSNISQSHGGSYIANSTTVGRRRPRETVDSRAQNPNQSVFSTAAGTHYSLLNASSRAELVAQQQQQQQQRRQQRRDRLERLGAWSFEDTWAAVGEENQCLVRPLVNAVVAWGRRVAGVRVDLYASLLCLSLIPGVTVEEVMLRRQQDALFDLLASDIAGATVDHGRRRAALELLIQLLQVSSTVRAGFVMATPSSVEMRMTPALSTTAEQCALALLKLVDDGVHGFLTKGGDSLGELLWLIRGTFDFLSVVSQDNVSSVLGSTVLDVCLNLRSWTQSSQVVLGHTADSNLMQPSTMPVEANKEVLMRLLLGAVRWFNVLLSQASDSPCVLDALQQFVRTYRHVVEYALNAPIAQAHVRPLTTVHLTLYAEITCMLEWLSASPLVEDCRVLVPALALTRLLGAVANDSFIEGQWFTGDYAASSDALVALSTTQQQQQQQQYQSQERVFGTAGPASLRQRDLILLTVRNIAHLLVRTELGPLHIVGLQSDAAAVLRHKATSALAAGSLLHRQLRSQPVEMESVTSSLNRLADVTLRAANGATTNLTLESLLLSLHALVCLCHSFVLPTSCGATDEEVLSQGGDNAYTPPAAAATSTTGTAGVGTAKNLSGTVRFDVYLQSVPVAFLLTTLRRVQQAVYALHALNADYRAGLFSRQAPNGFVLTTDSMSNRLTANAGDRLSSIVSPGHGTGSLTDDRSGSHHGTPLSAPVTARSGTKPPASTTGGGDRRHAQGRDRDHTTTTPGTPRISLEAGRGGNSRLLGAQTPHASAFPEDRPSFGTTQPRKTLRFADQDDSLRERQFSNEQTDTFDSRMASAEEVPRGVTIGDLMSPSGRDETTATSYVAFPADHRDGRVTQLGDNDARVEDPDDFVYAGSADWEAILALEHTSRQLKVGIANAIAATEDAAKTLGLEITA